VKEEGAEEKEQVAVFKGLDLAWAQVLTDFHVLRQRYPKLNSDPEATHLIASLRDVGDNLYKLRDMLHEAHRQADPDGTREAGPLVEFARQAALR
jgi:hypothetical protein